MTLAELFHSIVQPVQSDAYQYAAMPIPNFQSHRIAKDRFSNPVLLLSVADQRERTPIGGLKLQNISVLFDVSCLIKLDNDLSEKEFTAIRFIGKDEALKQYFLKLCSSLVVSLGNAPTQDQVRKEVAHFIELFRLAMEPPVKTAQGLWAELFLIAESKRPERLVQYWHAIPEERFDFNAGLEKVEVKSNSYFERIHSFSASQLNPAKDTQVLVASIFVRQSSTGVSIQDLMDSMAGRVKDEELLEKLSRIVYATMGNALEQALKLRFDYQIAKDSIAIYRHQDVPKISEEHIPTMLSDVRFTADLSKSDETQLADLSNKGELFSAL